MRSDKKTRRKLAKGYGVYAEFLGTVFQMFGLILLGTLLGQFLDHRLFPEVETAWCTIVCSSCALGLALYMMILKAK